MQKDVSLSNLNYSTGRAGLSGASTKRGCFGSETLIFWLVSEFWPSTPQKRWDTLDTPVSSYKHKHLKGAVPKML